MFWELDLFQEQTVYDIAFDFNLRRLEIEVKSYVVGCSTLFVPKMNQVLKADAKPYQEVA